MKASEEDTFNRLRRPSLAEMENLYQERKRTYVYVVQSSFENIDFAKKHGWDWLEFLKARKNAGYMISG